MKERALLLGKLKGMPAGEDAFSPHGGKALQFYLKNVATFIFCCMSEEVSVVSEKFISFLRAELHSCTSAHKNSLMERALSVIKKPALIASSSTTITEKLPANKKNTPLKSLSNPPAKKQKIPAHDNEEYYYPLGEFSSYLYETEDHKKSHHPSANKQKNKPYSASHEKKTC